MATIRRLNNEVNFTIGRNDLPKALREMRGFKAQVSKIGKEFDSFMNRKPVQSSEFLNRMKAMQQSAISTNHTLSELGKTMGNIKTEGAVNQVNNLRKSLKGASEDAKKVQTSANGGGVMSGGGRRGGRISKVAGFGEINRQLGTAAFSYGFGNFIRKSIYDTYEMEEARARLQKISGQDIAGEELVAYQKLNDLRNQEMSRRYATSRKEIYDLQASVSEAGFGSSKQQQLAIGMTEQILQASKLFALPVEEAKKGILKLVQQAGITSETVLEEWISRINLMEQQIPGGGKDIIQFMSRSAGSGKLIGLNPDEIVAMSALGTALSSSTYMGATAQRAILTKIGQSTFTTRQAEGLKALGYDVEEVSKGKFQSKKYNKVANEQGSFAAVLELFKSIRSLSMKGKEGSVERNTARRAAMEAVINFLGQGLKTENATKMATSMIDEIVSGKTLNISKLESLYASLQEKMVDKNGNIGLKRDVVKELELARVMESQRFKMETFVKAWENFRIAFVEEVLPFFTDILNSTIVPALYAFGKLPKVMKYVLVFATALMALVLPLMIIVTGFATLAGVLGIKGALIVGGIVTIAGSLTWLAEKIMNAKDGVLLNVKTFFKNLWEGFTQGMKDLWSNISDSFEDFDKIKQKWDASWIKTVLEVLFISIKSLLDLITNNPIVDWLIGRDKKNIPTEMESDRDRITRTLKPRLESGEFKSGVEYMQAVRNEQRNIDLERSRNFLGAIDKVNVQNKMSTMSVPANNIPLISTPVSSPNIAITINGANMTNDEVGDTIIDKLANFINLQR